MKYSAILSATVLGLIVTGFAPRSHAQSATEVAAAASGGKNARAAAVTLEVLALSVEQLRQEVRQLKIELHQLRIASLERELEQVRASRARIETEQDLLRQDAIELDEQLNQPSDTQSYATLLAARTSLVGDQASAITQKQDAALQRETDIIMELNSQRRQLQALIP